MVTRFDDAPVSFVTFDMSTRGSRTFSSLMASALGVRDLYDDRFGSSACVVLIDPRTQPPLGELTTRHGRDDMERLVRNAIERAS